MAEENLRSRMKAFLAKGPADAMPTRASSLRAQIAQWRERQLAPPPEAIWCVLANVSSRQADGALKGMRLGTKHFSPNTRVFLFPGVHNETVKVLGRHRGSARLVAMYMPLDRLTNFRAKRVGHPMVIKELGHGLSEPAAREAVSWLISQEATLSSGAGGA